MIEYEWAVHEIEADNEDQDAVDVDYCESCADAVKTALERGSLFPVSEGKAVIYRVALWRRSEKPCPWNGIQSEVDLALIRGDGTLPEFFDDSEFKIPKRFHQEADKAMAAAK